MALIMDPPAQLSPDSRAGKEFLHHEVLEPGVVRQAGREIHVAAEAMRFPDEIPFFVLADDLDHPAHYRDLHARIVAAPHLDHLLRVAVDELVPAEEEEFGA